MKASEKAGTEAAKGGGVRAPSISLPKGGGAIRGIGEKFGANPVTGTGSMTVPIATSPGRSGFGPQLALSYDSGSGNGPFGFGWALSTPAITRKTDKGLPQYRDAEESDAYVLSGAEDLVPLLRGDGTRFEDHATAPGYVIHRYRPRIEGLFARIERWTRIATGEIHWRSITRDNVTTLYGMSNNSRISDPAGLALGWPARVFSWLICQSYDDRGNAIVYTYAEEDDANVDRTESNERNRQRMANRYLKRIQYGNRSPNRDAATGRATDPTQLPDETWMFDVLFDYGEGHYAEDAPDAEGRLFAQARLDPPANAHWPIRKDRFSTYRAGFEVRTYRLCRRLLLFHHFPQELDVRDCLVRSTEFSYSEGPVASFLNAVVQSGYVRQPQQNQANRYLKKSLPPLEFEYSQVPSHEQLARQPVRALDAQSLENLPVGLDSVSYQWMDLDGEGTSGILTEQADGWYYKRNLSANSRARVDEVTVARFGPAELVANKPVAGLAGGAQFLDLAGDGQVDLVQMEGPLRGFYERTADAGWVPFQPFASWPDLNTRDPNLRFADLTGDGHADILITEGEGITWYASLGEAGFARAARVSLSLDEEKGPRLVFSDGEQSIYLADLSGDGLSDLVRVRNGEVCYWPNLGYGQFGAKVTMDNAPCFDSDDQFQQRRIRLADTDGSGTTDILYLRRDGVQIYFNQSGNGWSDAVPLPQFPPSDSLSSVQALDLLSNGTACLVWSSPLPGAARQPMHYLALMDEKPHLLVGMKNNLGAETRVRYESSAKFYLDDKRDGKPWITRLPFPVHVVERVETCDCVSGNRFVTLYAYHHGHFDGEEREFRGFGMVEQLDTEKFRALRPGGQAPTGTNIGASSHVPPVLTKTWFHTGVYDEAEEISRHFAAEYYGAPERSDPDYDAKFDLFLKTLLPDTVIPPNRTLEEEREACRALKGSMLRQEVYALDGTGKQKHPYTVTEQNFTIRALQPRGDNRHGVFFTHARESISYHYERQPADPRIGHALSLEVDEHGNVLKLAAIGYGRRQPVPDPNLHFSVQAEQKKSQAKILITYTENGVTNAVDTADDHRTPLPCESRTFELTGVFEWQDDYSKALEEYFGPRGRDCFTFDEILDAGANAIPIDYEKDTTVGRLEKRLIEHVRTYYRCNDLTGPLPLGELQSLALPFESFKLAFTPGLLVQVFGGRVTVGMLDGTGPTPGGGYVHTENDSNWWIPSGQIFYSKNPNDAPAQELAYARQHFFLPHRYRDPFHTNAVSTESFVTYDAYDLLVEETLDALDNRVTVGERHVDPTQPLVRRTQDYRVLQPALVMDPNRNCSEVAFDALGMVVGTAVMGKPEENPRPGDRFNAAFHADLTQDEIDQFLANPKGPVTGMT